MLTLILFVLTLLTGPFLPVSAVFFLLMLWSMQPKDRAV